MKTSKKALALLLSLVVLFTVSCSSSGGEDIRDENTVIKEMILAYGNDRDGSSEKLKALDEELAEMAPERAEKMKKVIEIWKSADKLAVNKNLLPGNLEDEGLCIVVLGYELKPDGTMQNELIGRLTVALNCAAKYPDALVLCTGGGTAASAPNVTEAELMGRWLVSHGLSEDRLIVENRSLNTVQNAEYTYDILSESRPDIKSIALVSSGYHIPWATLLFECVSMEKGMTDKIKIISNAGYDIYNEKYADVRAFESAALIGMYTDNGK